MGYSGTDFGKGSNPESNAEVSIGHDEQIIANLKVVDEEGTATLTIQGSSAKRPKLIFILEGEMKIKFE